MLHLAGYIRKYSSIMLAVCFALIVTPLSLYAGRITHEIHSGSYEFIRTPDGDQIRMDHFGYLRIPGKPMMPYRIFTFAIPPDAEVATVTIAGGKAVALEKTYQIRPAPAPSILGREIPAIQNRNQEIWERNHDTAYKSDHPFPEHAGAFVRKAGFRKYNLVDVAITPFQYRPASGILTYHPVITVTVGYEFPKDGKGNAVLDYSPRMEINAQELIFNYGEAQAWYPPPDEMSSRDVKDFVIITSNALTGAVASLVNWETAKGRSPEVVTLEWISTNYSGIDLEEKTRNFLRDKYPTSEWGIEDVLLAGNVDLIEMRTGCEDVGYGRPRTDFYYAELSLSDAESWDLNGNRLYGEPDGDQIDFYAEVNIGRIPWSDATNLQHVCQKSEAFEQNNDPLYKKNILLLGAFWYDIAEAATMMEVKVDHAWLSDWNMMRMYEQNIDYYSSYPCDYPLLRSNVVNQWSNEKFAFVNWGGHGSATTCHILGLGAPAFIHSSDCSSLNDNYPAIIFACCCNNVDPNYSNIGREMLKHGAVGFVGSSQVALGTIPWYDPADGSGQSCDYWFTNNVLSGNYPQGDALRRAMLKLYLEGGWHLNHYETYCWNLWGNPDLRLGGNPPVNHEPELAYASLSPDFGYYGTRYEFTVKYYDVDEDMPAGIYVNIDGADHAMVLDSGSDSDGFYRYRTRDISTDVSHAYYFHADDGNGATVRLPSSGTFSGPANYNPDLYLSGTAGPGAWMTVEVWGCVDALWASAWSSQDGPYYLPASGLTYDIGPGDLHMAKRFVSDPVHLDAFGYGNGDFRLGDNVSSGIKYIQATTKMNAYWAKTNRETFIIP